VAAASILTLERALPLRRAKPRVAGDRRRTGAPEQIHRLLRLRFAGPPAGSLVALPAVWTLVGWSVDRFNRASSTVGVTVRPAVAPVASASAVANGRASMTVPAPAAIHGAETATW